MIETRRKDVKDGMRDEEKQESEVREQNPEGRSGNHFDRFYFFSSDS
jgi:hypothetical protein